MTARTTRPSSLPPRSRPAPRGCDRRFRTWSTALVLLVLATVLPMPVAGADDPPSEPDLDRGLAAWLTLRSWLDENETPSVDDDAASLEVPGLTATGVLLRLDGRVVGRGFDPEGDDRAIRRAYGRAVAQVLGDRVIRDLPEPWRSSPGRRLTLELELAGARSPLVGGTLAAAARRLDPGVDGVAVVRGETIAIALPGRLLAIGQGDDMAATLIRLLDEVGLPPKDLPELRRLDSVRLERFRTLRLGQAIPGDLPGVRQRSGAVVPRVPLVDLDLDDLVARLADRLARWQAPAASEQTPDAAESSRPWLGDYDPIARTHRPFDAPTADRLLAIWALSTVRSDAATVPRPEAIDDAERGRADLIDLALLASAATGDEDAARAWLAALDDASPADEAPGVSRLARRAAALGGLPPRLVDDASFDAAYHAAWNASTGLPDVVAAFDWLALTELAWWRRHGTPGPRLESLRAVREALLVRQLQAPGDDRDGAIPLRRGLEEVPDARSLRPLLALAALQTIPDDEMPRSERAERGIAGLVRFTRQLMLTPDEAADLPGGRTAVWGVQTGLADPRQPIAATATALLAVDLLRSAEVAPAP